ncbi:MAG TPA: hypothetical protein VMB71_12810, partial [Acetobacteraceae bacterium]|nr:hypothetical protein [Acetobacteraceae bacterium]
MTNQISATLSGRRLAMLASAAMAALAFAAPARAQQGLADFFNEWDTPTLDPQTNSFGPTGIQMVFAGDAISDGCLPPQVTADSLINPFYAWQVWAFGGGHAHHTSVIYDITDNETLVTMSNTVPLIVPPPIPGSGFPGPTDGNGSGGHTYHSGLNQGYPGNCATNPQVKKRWIWKRHHTIQYQDIPFVQSVWPGQV